MRRTVPPSAEIEEQIDQLLAVGVGENPRESLSSLAKLGARLIIQRAVEDEFDAWLGRARYDRRPDYQRGLENYQSGLRNGFRPRKLQTAEGELSVEIPQIRQHSPGWWSVSRGTGHHLARYRFAGPSERLSEGRAHARVGRPMKIKGCGSVSVGFCEDFGQGIGRGSPREGRRGPPVESVSPERWLNSATSVAFWAGEVAAGGGRRVVEEPSGR